MASQAQKFLATIYQIWMMRHVDVPNQISRTLAKQLQTHGGDSRKRKIAQVAARNATKVTTPTRPKYIPVIAIVNGCTARVTLMPAGGGHYRIQLNTALRKAARADVGDVVSVELRLDLASREPSVPADL
ncbi:MAG: DUF1905 domain-containing protein, partial [Candidatus Acidiferrales bacterium]